MNIRSRLDKLEQRQPRVSTGPWEMIGVRLGETEQTACDRWLMENPDKKELPENIIFLVAFAPKQKEVITI